MLDKILNIVEYLRDFNFYSVVVRLVLATILSGIIGIERSKTGRAAGLRTHILVCLGATIASMTGLYIDSVSDMSGDVTRIAAQVVSGIGFLGAGTILVKNKSIVTGLTTAACVWATGSIGIAVGYGFYEAAMIGALLIFFITGKLGSVDKKLCRDITDISVYIEFLDAKFLNDTLDEIKNKGYLVGNITLHKARANVENGIGAEIILHSDKKTNSDEIVKELKTTTNINFVIATQRGV